MVATTCARSTAVSMALFEDLLKDEEGHINFLETQLRLLKEIGAENYGQLQAEATDAVETGTPGKG